MGRLACWCAQWTSIDRGTTGVEEAGWRARLKACAFLLPGCRCSPAACRCSHRHPPLPSPNSRPEPSLRAKVPTTRAACARYVSPFAKDGLEGLDGRSVRHERNGCKWESLPSTIIYSGQRVPGDDEAAQSSAATGRVHRQTARAEAVASNFDSDVVGWSSSLQPFEMQARSRYTRTAVKYIHSCCLAS